MIQSGRHLGDLATVLLEATFRTRIEAAKRVALILAKNPTNYFVNETIMSVIYIYNISSFRNNIEIKDIIKIIKSLENREILLKGTTRKLLVKKEMDFLIF